MQIHYHQRTFALLEVKPVIDDHLLDLLQYYEKHYNISLPLAVREWYSIDGSVQILNRYSNGDVALDLEEIGHSMENRSGYRYWDFQNQDMIPIMIENQASFLWAIHLNGSDDPPVGYWDEDDNWSLCSSTFSSFIEERIWEHLYWGEDCVILSESGDIDRKQLSDISSNMIGDAYEITLDSVFHIHSGKKHIIIFKNDNKRCRWTIRATSAEDLFISIESILKVVPLQDKLAIRYPFGMGCAENVIRKIHYHYNQRPDQDDAVRGQLE